MRALLAAALVSLLPACAAARGAPAPYAPYALELVDEAGAPLPRFEHRGRSYVLGARGQRYLLRVRNDSGRRVEVVASVDGRDVLDGRPAAHARRGYLVEPGAALTIAGFRTSDATVAAFRFGGVAESYAARTGDALDVGVVGAAFFPERPRPPPRPVARAERSAGAARGKTSSSPPPSSPGAAAEAQARTEDRPGLGTSFGEEHDSRVVEVPFERASARPEAVLAVRYDDRDGLLALGVDVDGRRALAAAEARRREQADPFRGSRYAAPPPGWEGR